MPRRVIASGRSCFECRRRKIKCDRSFPCAYCVKVRVQCSYPPRRAERTRSPSGSPEGLEGSLEGRVERIEDALETLGRDLSRIKDLLLATANHSSGSSWNNDSRDDQINTLLHEASTQGTNLSLSAGFDQQNPEQNAAHSGNSENRNFAWEHATGRDSPLRSLFKSELVSNLKPLHPSPVTISFLWQKYLENVDPLIKIFHAPTVQKQVMNLVRGRKDHNSPAECLMFAIYYSTVMTMEATECQAEFDENKEELLNRYRTGVENALFQAHLLNSVDLSVLQAFLIYLICGRRDKAGPNVRKLMDFVIGMGVKMDLHHDGDDQDISPFEVEIRRRLWWHICILDARAAESDGSAPRILESLFNTKLPTNVSDANLDPAMGTIPRSQTGKTDMLFSLIRFEVSYFGRKIVFSDQFCRENGYEVRSPLEKCRLIDAFRVSIEKRCLSHCDSKVPLDFVAIASTRLILVRFKLTVAKPRAGVSQKDIAMPGNFRGICVDVLQHARALRGYEHGKQWLWLFQTYVEWEALACLLLDLCLTLSDTPDESAWGILEEVYNYWKQHEEVNRCGIWANIERLYSQVLTMRDSPEAIISNDQNMSTPGVSSSEHLSLMWELADIAAVAANMNTSLGPVTRDEAAEMPTSGTACEWSVGVFEQYFGMMDLSFSSA